MLLLTALVGLAVALLTAVFQRARGSFHPETVAFSPDGSAVAARFTDGTVNVWDAGGDRIGTFDTRGTWLNWGSESSFQLMDRRWLVTLSEAGQFQVWSVEQEELRGQFGSVFPSPFWETACISGNGERAASMHVGTVPGVDIWDVRSGSRIRKLPILSSSLRMALSHDGTRLATIDQNGAIRLWDVETGQRIAGPFSSTVNSADSDVVFSSDAAVVTLSDPMPDDPGQTGVVVFDLTRGELTQTIVLSDASVQSLALSPGGETLAVIDTLGTLKVFDVASGEQQGAIDLRATGLVEDLRVQVVQQIIPTTRRPAMRFSADGASLLVGTGGEVALIDVPTVQRKEILWRPRQRLGKWFFAPAFILWATLWGLNGRRANGASVAEPDGEPANASESEDADESAEEASTEEAALDETASDDATESGNSQPQVSPPPALKAVWAMMFGGGVVAIAWSMWMIFSPLSCIALSPFPYYSLLVGLRAISAAAGRSIETLRRVAGFQLLNLACCDPVNLVLGLAELWLLRSASVRAFRSSS